MPRVCSQHKNKWKRNCCQLRNIKKRLSKPWEFNKFIFIRQDGLRTNLIIIGLLYHRPIFIKFVALNESNSLALNSLYNWSILKLKFVVLNELPSKRRNGSDSFLVGWQKFNEMSVTKQCSMNVRLHTIGHKIFQNCELILELTW